MILYSYFDPEHLYHTTPEEAVDEVFDKLDHDDVPALITIKAYVNEDKPTPESIADWVLEDLIENLDQDFGNPDGPSHITEVMREAAIEFLTKVLDEYTVWACKRAPEQDVMIDTAAWRVTGGK